MRYFNIKLAGKVIRIGACYSKAYVMCEEFKVNDEPDIYIETDQNDFNRETTAYKELQKQGFLSDVYLEPLILLRKISDRFIDYNILLMHGAAIVYNNETYIFTAASGTGKTTHILKWLKECPGTYVLNGDKPFILTYEDGRHPLVCGSPWGGKEELFSNNMVPLKAIILMERNEDNFIEQVSFLDAFPSLLQQVYRPEDENKMRKTLKILQRLNSSVTFWRFRFNNFKDDCFCTSYHALVADKKECCI